MQLINVLDPKESYKEDSHSKLSKEIQAFMHRENTFPMVVTPYPTYKKRTTNVDDKVKDPDKIANAILILNSWPEKSNLKRDI